MARQMGSQERVPTSVLLAKIKATKNIKTFILRYQEQLNQPTLAGILEELCAEKGILPKDVVKDADIDRVYGAKIFAGKRTNPSRDYVLKLAFGLRLDYDECQRLLAVAGTSTLYPRVPRDAVLISCLHNKLTYQQTQERLYDTGMPLLGEEHDGKQDK